MKELSNARRGAEHSVDSSENELSTKGFIERMNHLVTIAGSANALAKKAGISQGGIRRYFEGGEPTLSILVSLSAVTGVNLLWLATGQGPMRPGESGGDQPPTCVEPLSAELLKAVIKAVKDAVAAGKYDLSTSQEAELITGVYGFSAAGPPGTPIPRAAVDHLLRAIKSENKEKQ